MVNVKPVQLGKNTRMSFSHINEVLDMPNLIEIQKNSYDWFLKEGLKEVFDDVSGITDFNGNLVLGLRELQARRKTQLHGNGMQRARCYLCGSPARHCTPSQQGNGRDQGI